MSFGQTLAEQLYSDKRQKKRLVYCMRSNCKVNDQRGKLRVHSNCTVCVKRSQFLAVFVKFGLKNREAVKRLKS